MAAKQVLSKRDTTIIIKNKGQARALCYHEQKYLGGCTIIQGLHVATEIYFWSRPRVVWEAAAN